MFIFFLALTWSTAPMSAFSKDFESLIVSVMSGIFWLSGIMYNSYGFDSPFLNKLMLINPINFFVNGYRNCFLYNRPFYANKTECLVFAIEFVVIFALGIFNYNRLRKNFLMYFKEVILWLKQKYPIRLLPLKMSAKPTLSTKMTRQDSRLFSLSREMQNEQGT